MRIEFTAQIQKADFVKIMAGQQMKRTSSVLMITIGTSILILTVIYFVLSLKISLALIYLFACAVFILIYFPLRYRYIFYKQFNSNKAIQSLIAYKLSDEGVYVKGDGVEGLSSFDMYHKVLNTSDAIFLYMSTDTYNILFKRWFTDEQLKEFINFLQTKTNLKMEGF
ncbi:MAG: YcxB family protein [Sphingobacteriales bacterium JAD_PAG50586_3]|nr:MAG: YcxB family protein [Sphingobacteriales bacterium JAD_PAG50586_3]